MTNALLEGGLLVYGTILGFELIDRTNFAVIGLAARHEPRAVWYGATIAFLITSAFAVVVGYVIVTELPAYLPWLKVVGGAILIAYGVHGFLVRAVKAEVEVASSPSTLSRGGVVTRALGLVLLLETGDNTQILTILFVGGVGNAFVVFLAAFAALSTAAAIGATNGAYLKRRLPPARLERILSSILIVVGAVTLSLGVLELAHVALPSWL